MTTHTQNDQHDDIRCGAIEVYNKGKNTNNQRNRNSANLLLLILNYSWNLSLNNKFEY